MVAKRDELARTRRAAGYTQEQLAEVLGVDVKTIGNWESGKTEPLPYKRPKLAAVLHVSAARLEELLHVDPAVERSGEHESPDADAIGPASGQRRPLPATRLPHHRQPDRQADLATIQAMATAFQVADRKVGGGQIYPTVVTYLQTEISPRLFDPASDILGERLFQAAASLTEIAGWMAHDSGYDQHAQRHFSQSYRLARAADHPALLANISASMSHLAGQLHQAKAAVRIAQVGLAHAERGPGRQRLTARLYAMTARGLAMQGDADASRQALVDAERVLERLHEDGPAEWISQFDEAALASEAALCYDTLGDRRQAERQARRVLELRVGDRVRSRAFGQLTLAEVLVGGGEIDEAASLGREVCAALGSLTSARVRNRLTDLKTVLQPHRSALEVQLFLAECTHVLQPATASEADTAWPV
ncbi:helix-turn-helix domain-containing protein [Amycolatopsis sp., V23-08]|uniref:Helix-turn-helix domain-containing protein n=1 Tax=Amycolatopsis heterodermiae TaxID=3110235 RepID=A0ABU5QXU2_9PSEU|nr:helix-turn-helix domain-containing protein [Amycolatopsis sp., V23-08]MEA5358748.1 helix-turn-helix domain-containing protein [Amycolatopsis sp., V23-08]